MLVSFFNPLKSIGDNMHFYLITFPPCQPLKMVLYICTGIPKIIHPLFLLPVVSSVISSSKLFHIHLYSLLVTIFIYNKFLDIFYRSNGKKVGQHSRQKNIILLRDMRISQDEISHRLKISYRCIHQTFRKFNKFHSVPTKPVAGRPPKVTDREKRLSKL